MTIDEIRAANAAAGQYFFSPDTMRFFRSRVGRTVYGGRFFVTSEEPPHGPRAWTVRVARPDGSIETVGGFMAHTTRADAIAAARKAARAAQ